MTTSTWKDMVGIVDVHRQKSDINTLQHAINNAMKASSPPSWTVGHLCQPTSGDYYDISADKDVTQNENLSNLTADINTLGNMANIRAYQRRKNHPIYLPIR